MGSEIDNLQRAPVCVHYCLYFVVDSCFLVCFDDSNSRGPHHPRHYRRRRTQTILIVALRTSISVMSLAMVDPRIKEQRARKRFMIVVLELKKEVFEYKWTALSVEARIRKEASDCM